MDKEEIIEKIELTIRVYDKFHNGDSEDFANGFIAGLKDAINIIQGK